MKKLLVIFGALLMVAGSAFAQTTVADQDSCDIAVSPAATLLLPYFSVDPDAAPGSGESMLVAITNVSAVPANAHIVVWSNLSYPVLDFNIFLSGYDVESFSLFDLLVNGDIPVTGSYSSKGAYPFSPVGDLSEDNKTGNVNAPLFADADGCASALSQGGEGRIPQDLLDDIRSGLTGGSYSNCDQIALETEFMTGYITIDVTNQCSTSLPFDPGYFTTEMLYDNQLIGDYVRINYDGGVAGASPLVHIKALPPGGPAGAVASGLTRTFYQRYQAGYATTDRRQPLPSEFAARYIDEDGGSFDTDFAVWREGITGPTALCTPYEDWDNLTEVEEIIRFDETENPLTIIGGCPVSPCFIPTTALPEAWLVNIADSSTIPPDPSSDEGGWVYFNLNNPDRLPLDNQQGWVQVRMTAGTFGVDFDAAYMANGCSAYRPASGLVTQIGPWWP